MGKVSLLCRPGNAVGFKYKRNVRAGVTNAGSTPLPLGRYEQSYETTSVSLLSEAGRSPFRNSYDWSRTTAVSGSKHTKM